MAEQIQLDSGPAIHSSLPSGRDVVSKVSIDACAGHTESGGNMQNAPLKNCRWCLNEIECANPRKEFCGAQCRKRHASRRNTHPRDVDGYGARMSSAWPCRDCGRHFDAGERVQGARPILTCSECRLPTPKSCPCCSRNHRGQHPACSNRCSRELRRRHFVRKAGVRADRVSASPEPPIISAEIFERDGWICQLCLDPVDVLATHPEPCAPVIDHIIPIALNGLHVRANVQCAHSRCNTMKGASLLEDLGGTLTAPGR